MGERECRERLNECYFLKQVSCQQFLGVMMFESARVLIGGLEALKIFGTSNYVQHIKMMLLYEESYREIHFYSLGELVTVVCNCEC